MALLGFSKRLAFPFIILEGKHRYKEEEFPTSSLLLSLSFPLLNNLSFSCMGEEIYLRFPKNVLTRVPVAHCVRTRERGFPPVFYFFLALFPLLFFGKNTCAPFRQFLRLFLPSFLLLC